MENQLALTKTLTYESLQLRLTDFENELESREYEACRFKINGLKVVCRTAKITPAKTGQFVTLWKRIAEGPIAPLDDHDAFELVLINVKKAISQVSSFFQKQCFVKGASSRKNQRRTSGLSVSIHPGTKPPADKLKRLRPGNPNSLYR